MMGERYISYYLASIHRLSKRAQTVTEERHPGSARKEKKKERKKKNSVGRVGRTDARTADNSRGWVNNNRSIT
jgi:hypothetical protein